MTYTVSSQGDCDYKQRQAFESP